jgi:hypothetical protein
MLASHVDWTVEMLDVLPEDGNRYEIIDGLPFVRPSPSYHHQRVVGELHARLLAYVKPLGERSIVPLGHGSLVTASRSASSGWS